MINEKTCHCDCRSGESCPTCERLQCLERPRYFAGQLLTEAELNSEQAYVRAKMRLQNRYLHGSGVVCGLKVVCHECDGRVRIEPGYAIDPCGNDIVVCDPHDINILEEIERYKARHSRETNCPPNQNAYQKECEDEEERWCIVVRYREQEIRPTVPQLNRSGNGCNISSASQTCEPTRISESYQIEVIPGECCTPKWYELLSDLIPALRTRGGILDKNRFGVLYNALSPRMMAFGNVLAGFATKGEHNLKDNPAESVAGISLLSSNVLSGPSGGEQLAMLLDVVFKLNPLEYGAVCFLQERLNRLRVALINPQDNTGAAGRAYLVSSASIAYYEMIDLFTEYIIGSICDRFAPPCPEESEKDYLILACVDVREVSKMPRFEDYLEYYSPNYDEETSQQGRELLIAKLSNWCCREHAGAFPSQSHWLNMIPVLPMLHEILKLLCCDPDIIGLLIGRRKGDRLTDERREAEEEPVEFVEAEEVMRRASASVRSTLDSVRRTAVGADPESVVVMADVAEIPLEEASDTLAAARIEVTEVVNVEEVEAVPRSPLFAKAGDRLIAYRDPDGVVVGYQRVDDVREAEIASLRSELDGIRAQMEAISKEGRK